MIGQPYGSLLPYLMQSGMTRDPLAPLPDNPITRSLRGSPTAPQPGLGEQYGGSAPQPPRLAAPAMDQPEPRPMPNLSAMSSVGRRDPLAPKPKPFGKDGVGWKILGIIGDGMLGYAGRPPIYAPHMQKTLEMEMEEQARERQRMAPRIEQVGNTVGMLDPSQGAFNPLYTAPSVAGQYAIDRGFQPGTPEYQEAVQDYRLGAWSDEAVAAKTGLEGVRYGYRDQLQDQRLDVTRRGQDLTSRDRRRGQDISRGNSVRSNETRRGAYSYSNPSGGRRGVPAVEPRAIAANGKPIVVRGGKWVYADSGALVE